MESRRSQLSGKPCGLQQTRVSARTENVLGSKADPIYGMEF